MFTNTIISNRIHFKHSFSCCHGNMHTFPIPKIKVLKIMLEWLVGWLLMGMDVSVCVCVCVCVCVRV